MYGYVMVRVPKDYPYKHEKGWVQEHRYVMQNHLQRSLLPNENVHHINCIKGDNRLENLELWQTTQPRGARVEDLVFNIKQDLHAQLFSLECINNLTDSDKESIAEIFKN